MREPAWPGADVRHDDIASLDWRIQVPGCKCASMSVKSHSIETDDWGRTRWLNIGLDTKAALRALLPSAPISTPGVGWSACACRRTC